MAFTIQITTFVNPHKFWFFDENDENKRKELQTIINKEASANLVEISPYPFLDCIIFHKSEFKRGSILDVGENNVKVWLTDHGIMVETAKVFKIHDQILSYKTFLKQGALNNVIPSTYQMEFDAFKFQPEKVEKFTPGAIKIAKSHLAKAKKIMFINEQCIQDIFCGEIILYKDMEKYSLNKLLLSSDNCLIDEKGFTSMINAACSSLPNRIVSTMLENLIGDEEDLSVGIGRGIIRSRMKRDIDNVEIKDQTITDESESENYQILDTESSESSTSLISRLKADKRKADTTEEEKSNSDVPGRSDAEKSKHEPYSFKPPEIFTHSKRSNLKKEESLGNVPTGSNDINQQINIDNVSKNENDCKKTTNPALKLGCQCENCSMWHATDLKGQKLVFEKQKAPRQIKKPKLLFKNAQTKEEDMPQIHSILESHRRLTPTILAQGYMVPAPVQSVAKLPFNEKTMRLLDRLKYKMPKPVQVYAWSSIMRRMNVFVANAPRTGKTMTYVLPLISFITEKSERYGNLPPENGPIIIILCSECNSADSIYAILTEVLSIDKSIKVCLAVPPLDKYAINQFQGACDILITTPMTLLNLLHSFTMNLKRLCHLVLEQTDLMLEKVSKEVYTLFNAVDSMLEHRNCGYPVQLIFTSERWTISIENLLKQLQSLPIVIIGQALEAAMYGKPDIQMHFTSSHKKKSIMGDILRAKDYYYKTLIMCNTESEIKAVERFIVAEGRSFVAFRDTMPLETIKEYEMIWKRSKNNLIYICTDSFFKCYLNITDVGCLIHYNLPKDSWTSFCRRFSTLIDNYYSPFSQNENTMRCKVHIFVDETCENEFPKLQSFLLKICKTLPESFKEQCQKIYENNESLKIQRDTEFCDKLAMFGKCTLFNCPSRHNLDQNLENTDLPTSGTIHFRILNILDATTFAVEILEHFSLNSEVSTTFPNLYKKMEDQLTVICMKSRVFPSKIKLSNWYVWQQKPNEFRRVEVVEILAEHPMTKQPQRVKIKLIDCGGTKDIQTAQLYELPEKFKSLPKQLVLVRLTNFIPLENDIEWPRTIRNKIRTFFAKKSYDDEDSYFSSKIALTLGRNIWVKDMHLKEVLHVTDVIVTKFSLKNTFVKRNYGLYTEEPLDNLYKLCEKFHIDLPEYEVKVTPRPFAQVEPTWAFFEDKEYNEVYFSSAFSSKEFYVRLTKFDKVFKNFQKEIQNEIRKPLYKKDFEVVVGKYYLAKDPGGSDYCRVKVIDVNDDMVECFYVDYGDSAIGRIDELKFLTDEQITKLPFQAIECSLYGTAAVTDDMQNEIVDILYDCAFESNTEYLKTLFAKTMTKSRDENRNVYSIILCDTTNGKPININKIIIDSGFAVCIEDRLIHIQIDIPRKLKADEVNKEEEDEKIPESDSNIVQTKNENYDDEDINLDDWDIQITQPDKFFPLLGLTKYEAPKTTGSTKTTVDKPVVTPTTIAPVEDAAKYYSPDMLWHQSETHIKIEILLADVEEYVINVHRGNLFYFRTVHRMKEYQVILTLFEDVDKTFQHVVFGQLIRVTMKKLNANVTWPRLTLSEKKPRNIRYDYGKDTKAGGKPKPFLTLDIEESPEEDTNLQYDIGSDEDYDESDVQSSSNED